MDPALLVPHPEAIPVPYGWFQALLILTFVLHLLVMNTMLGSSIIASITELGSSNPSPSVNREISRVLPTTIAFTVNFGVAPLLFLQVLYGHFMYTSSVLMAVYWISIIGLLIMAYYSAYLYDFKFDALGGSRTIFIILTTGLLLIIGFFFTTNMTLMQRPDTWPRYFANPRGTLLNMADPTLWPRYLHFVAASVAIAGLGQALLARWRRSRTTVNTDADVAHGLRWFSAATAVQILIGFWFLMALPPDKMQLFLGSSVLATALLGIGLCTSLGALIAGLLQQVWLTAGTTLATVVIMVLMRDILRQAYLAPYFSLSDLNVVQQYSPMLLFLAAFVGGIGIIIYMLKLALAAGKEG